MTPSNYIELALFAVGILIAVYGFIYRLDKRLSVIEDSGASKLSDRVSTIEFRCVSHQAILDGIATLNQRLDKVEVHDDVFWKIVGPAMEKVIHSPKSVERDELVAKLTSGGISKDELPVLIDMLHEAIGKDEWSNEKRFAGILLLARATALFNEARYERRRTP